MVIGQPEAFEVTLDGQRYPIYGPIVRSLVSQYPGKILVGDSTRDSRPYTSLLSMSDFTGGMGIERLREIADVDRVWFSTHDLRFKGHLTLPPRADDIPSPLGASTLHAFERLGGYLYGVFGRQVYRYDGASWATSLHTLAGVFNTIKHVDLDGEDYLAIGHSEGVAYTNDGATWFENGQEV